MGAGTHLRIEDYLAKVCRSELVRRQPDVTLQQEKNQASVLLRNPNRLQETPPGRAQLLTNSLVGFKLVKVYTDFRSAPGRDLLKIRLSL